MANRVRKPISEETPEQREKRLAAKKRHYAKHRERYREYQAAYYPENKDRWRSSSIKIRYGLSDAQFKTLWSSQVGKCAICVEPLEMTKFGCHVDHSHGTGAVRGLLCGPCNLAIGHLKDSPTRADAAAAYLRQYDVANECGSRRSAA